MRWTIASFAGKGIRRFTVSLPVLLAACASDENGMGAAADAGVADGSTGDTFATSAGGETEERSDGTGGSADDTGEDEGGESAGEPGAEELPPFAFATVYGVPNLDDDDENGSADWYQAVFAADDDVSSLPVPPVPEGHAIELRLELSPNVRVWDDETFALGVAEDGSGQLQEFDTYRLESVAEGKTLTVEFGEYNARAVATATLLDPAGEVVETTEFVLQSSPLIMNHHLQPTERVWVVDVGAQWGGNAAMMEVYEDVLGPRFVRVPGHIYGYDVWIQDEVEFATSSGNEGQRLNTVIDSVRDRALDPFAEEMVVAPDFISRTWGNRFQSSTYDSFGNLEASPPVTVDGVEYPFGRIYYGKSGNQGLQDLLGDQLAAQGVQAPFVLDTTWLCVGHVDEFSTFIPDPSSPKGFKLLLSDVTAAYQLLETLDPSMVLTRYGQDHGYSTVGSLLADEGLRALNEDLQTFELDPIREQFKAELGLTDDDIIEVPALFEHACGSLVAALIPGTVNLVVANPEGEDTHLFVPDPFFRTNTSDQSSDPVLQDFRARMPDELQVHFVDDWNVYHMGLGEVHCGTNVQRTPITQWWTTAMHLLAGE